MQIEGDSENDGENDLQDGADCDDDPLVTPNSTKQPIKPRQKSLKKKLQEEEFNVLKGLASSLANDGKKANARFKRPTFHVRMQFKQ